MLLCSSLPPCRTQRRSLAGWRIWWRCTQLESEMWRSWRAWTCTAEPPGATLKSSRSRPTCTPTRARSDLCPPALLTRSYWSFSTVVDVCGTRKRCDHLYYTDLQLEATAALQHPRCGPFTEHLVWSHSFHPHVDIQLWHHWATPCGTAHCSRKAKQFLRSVLLFHGCNSNSVKWHTLLICHFKHILSPRPADTQELDELARPGNPQ